jgi:hypothetical protein
MAPPKLRDISHWCNFLYRAPIDYSASVLWFTSGIIPLLSRSILLLSISLSTYTYTLNNEELNWWDFFVIAVSVGERTSRDREYCTRFKTTKFRPPLFKKVKQNRGSKIHDEAKDLTVQCHGLHIYIGTL